MWDKILVFIEFFIGMSFAYDKVFLGVGLSMFILPKILREKFGHSQKHWTFISNKAEGILFFGGLAMGLMGMGMKYYFVTRPLPQDFTWGVTFSQKMSESFEVPWRESYEAIVNDLNPQGMRLIAYWDQIEPRNDEWKFNDLDFQMNLAAEKNIPVILAMGQKTPRWPECHIPSFARELLGSDSQFLNDEAKNEYENSLLDYLRVTTERYKNYSNLLYFQVENEPFFGFGECPPLNRDLFQEEVALVKSIDSSRPVLATDSGELGSWRLVSKYGDKVGTTLYQRVYNNSIDYLIRYPLSPQFYQLKATVAKLINNKPNQSFFIAELAAEPWGEKQIYEMSLETQLELFTLKHLEDAVIFARDTKFDSAYFWGVEWWYYLKTEGRSEYWDYAKGLMEG